MNFLINNEVFIYGFEINKKKVCAEWLKQVKGNKELFKRTEQKIVSNKNYFTPLTFACKPSTINV